MQLEWMGRYREIIRRIMRHGNLYANAYTVQLTDESGVVLSSLEWQAFECILEFEDENFNMSVLANKVGVPQSNFSKYVKTMVEKGLVERFHKDGNSKDVILKVTGKGREFYRIRSGIIAAEWKDVFAILDGFSEAEVAQFSLFVEKLTDSFDPKKEKQTKLVKIK